MQKPSEKQAAEYAQLSGVLEGLNFQRSELESQQGTLLRRRNQLDEQRQVASAEQRPAIEKQIAEIDARTATIDRQLLQLNDQISTTLAARTAVMAGQDAASGAQTQVIRIPQISIPPIEMLPPSARRSSGVDPTDVAAFLVLEALFLVAVGALFWRMGVRSLRSHFERMFAGQSQQINQLQQSMDVVGIEVERISEGQRYVAKVLSDGTKVIPDGSRVP